MTKYGRTRSPGAVSNRVEVASLLEIVPRLSGYTSPTASVSVSPGGSVNTKGSWTTLVASTTADFDMLLLSIANTGASTTNGSGLMDIAIGGSGSEVTIAANLNCGNTTTTFNADSSIKTIYVPVNVPAGSRISARYQRATGTEAALVHLEAFNSVPGLAPLPSSIDTYGANTAASKGVSFASMNTWTEITSATTQEYVGLFICPGSDTTSATSVTFGVDIGLGASGSEVAYYTPQTWTLYNTEQMWTYHAGLLGSFIPVRVPVGTRIAARMTTGAAVNGVHVTVHGVPVS